MQRRFTTRDVDALVGTYRDGATINELAARFGMHCTTIIHHLHRAGVRGRNPRKLTDRAVAEAAHRYQQGQTLDQLAKQFSVAPSTIRQALKAARVPIRRRGRRPGP